jgi:putative DNA primase/helicase
MSVDIQKLDALLDIDNTEPEPLPDGLPSVPAFDFELLPKPLRHRVQDIVDRMQCPPDYVAVALVVTLSSLVGRRVTVKPKREDDWTVVPNLWGAVVGRPGVLKSPALAEVMKPLRRLQNKAIELHEEELAEYKADEMYRTESEKVVKDLMRKLMKEGKDREAKERARDAAHGPDHRPRSSGKS